ncbi:MAG: ComEC/Rec2 family competence protein, partial [Planctomycetales bacterium]|nr:ComEC/Rec2 family competence protein [Planctomycetales bacterium]
VVGGFFLIARMGWAPRRGALVVIMLAILAYALLTGARPPVVRAAVLAELMCLALWQGRQVLAMNSLAAAAIVVLTINPCELFRTGAQLSFLAAATLISFGRWQLSVRSRLDPMTRLLRSVEPAPVKLIRSAAASSWTIFLATVFVWIVAAPIMSYRLNLLSPVAMPISVAVFPLVSASVLSGLVLLALELVFPPLAPLAAAFCGASTGLLDSIIDHSTEGCLFVPGPQLWWVLSAYALMFIGLCWGVRRWLARVLTYAGLTLVIAGFGPPLAAELVSRREPAPLRCTFIAVGHGVSVLIQTPQGGAFLYDAGSLGSPWLATDRISSVLWQRGVRRLDGVFLSHADVDHFNGLPGLIERFAVAGVYTSHQTFPRTLLDEEHTAPAELARLLQAQDIPVHRLALGDRVDLGGATAEVLFPTLAGVIDSDNANSLVIGIESAGKRVLLPGDLEGRGLEDLLLQEPYPATVLLAPHHGSPRYDPPGFARWSTPKHVVVSSALGVSSSTANLSYQAAGAQVYSTAKSGAITFTFSEPDARVETFCP